MEQIRFHIQEAIRDGTIRRSVLSNRKSLMPTGGNKSNLQKENKLIDIIPQIKTINIDPQSATTQKHLPTIRVLHRQ